METSLAINRYLAQQCILGTDFMRATGLVIDFKSMPLKSNNKIVPLKTGNKILVCRVVVPEIITIPAGHKILCIGKLLIRGRPTNSGSY